MLQFTIDAEKCIRCGSCAADCPARIIQMVDDFPMISKESEAACIRCQHCLAVCPTGAVSIFGIDPRALRLLKGQYPQESQMEALLKGRRSCRRYRDENLDPTLVERLLDVASHAPTGVNARQVRFTLIDDKERLAALRRDTYRSIGDLAAAGKLPPERAYFADFARLWEENGTDVLFRGAPHLLITSAPGSCPTPLPDALIALAYFELFAQTAGVGTVWNGLVRRVIDELVPELGHRLGIPGDHRLGYVMAFGPPAVRYYRTVQHARPQIVRW